MYGGSPCSAQNAVATSIGSSECGQTQDEASNETCMQEGKHVCVLTIAIESKFDLASLRHPHFGHMVIPVQEQTRFFWVRLQHTNLRNSGTRPALRFPIQRCFVAFANSFTNGLPFLIRSDTRRCSQYPINMTVLPRAFQLTSLIASHLNTQAPLPGKLTTLISPFFLPGCKSADWSGRELVSSSCTAGKAIHARCDLKSM